MDITLEQVEKVRSCTGATYEEAKAALEATGGNVLDAVILLEKQGKTGPAGGDYSTRGAGAEPEWPAGRRPVNWREVRRALKSLLANCLAISLEIWKGGRMTYEEREPGAYPFSPDGAPCAIHAEMYEIPWTKEYGRCRNRPDSTRHDAKRHVVEWIPYGCTNLRMTELPML